MPALKLAVQLKNLRLPLKKALPIAGRWGVAGIELDGRGEFNPQEISESGARQIRKLCEDHRLAVVALGFRTRRGYGVADELTRRVDATKAAMKLANSLGARLVVNQIGRVPEDVESAEWRLLVEVLADLGNYGQHIGAVLAAETGSESGPQLRRLIEALPAGSLAVTLNPGNLIINGFSPLEAVEALTGDIAYVHAKDGVRDLAQGRGVEVQLGRGSADFPALLGALEEHGYRGSICIEREQSDNPIPEIGDALEFLRSL